MSKRVIFDDIAYFIIGEIYLVSSIFCTEQDYNEKKSSRIYIPTNDGIITVYRYVTKNNRTKYYILTSYTEFIPDYKKYIYDLYRGDEKSTLIKVKWPLTRFGLSYEEVDEECKRLKIKIKKNAYENRFGDIFRKKSILSDNNKFITVLNGTVIIRNRQFAIVEEINISTNRMSANKKFCILYPYSNFVDTSNNEGMYILIIDNNIALGIKLYIDELPECDTIVLYMLKPLFPFSAFCEILDCFNWYIIFGISELVKPIMFETNNRYKNKAKYMIKKNYMSKILKRDNILYINYLEEFLNDVNSLLIPILKPIITEEIASLYPLYIKKYGEPSYPLNISDLENGLLFNSNYFITVEKDGKVVRRSSKCPTLYIKDIESEKRYEFVKIIHDFQN